MIEKYRLPICELIKNYLDELKDKRGENQMIEMFKYCLNNDSKKLRSIMMLICGETFGLTLSTLRNYVLAIEIIHTYTLIHDDLPALDNDEFRRGQLTAHKKFGEANAILLGDAMHSLAFELMSKKNKKISSDVQLDLINKFADTIGFNGVIYGEMLDINHNNQQDLLEDIHYLKTAKLFSFCSMLPAIIYGADICKYGGFGYYYGMAFQLLDDINDYGKTVKNEFNICNNMSLEEAKIKYTEYKKNTLNSTNSRKLKNFVKNTLHDF